MFTSFINALPDKVRSTDWFDEGSKFRKKEKALNHRYIELNQFYKNFIAWILTSQDLPFAGRIEDFPHLLLSSSIQKMRICHYLYELNTSVYYTEEARRAPQVL